LRGIPLRRLVTGQPSETKCRGLRDKRAWWWADRPLLIHKAGLTLINCDPCTLRLCMQAEPPSLD
jgi:hypothetical protein